MYQATVHVHANNSTTVRSLKQAPVALRAVRGGMRILSAVSPEGAAAVAERMFLTPRRRERPPAELEVLAGAEARALPSRHGDLAAWAWGPLKGPRVLLVHGWEGRGAQLGPLIEPLTAAGLRVLAFDAPGHGDSAGERSSLFHFADAVVEAAKAWGPLHAIVTHSMGGAATVWASRDGLIAGRLVLIAPPLDVGDFTRVLSRMLDLSEEVRGRVHGRLHRRFGVPVEALRMDRVASRLRGPLLVVHDEDDHEVPIACGEAIAGAWPEARLVRTRGLGHRRILRDAAIHDPIVSFVAGGRLEAAASAAEV
jgi:pimeloyl-ACP methyl ester carboxylesterase